MPTARLAVESIIMKRRAAAVTNMMTGSVIINIKRLINELNCVYST
jgi:hypothetical protein